MSKPTAVVVGSGASGGMVARLLAKSGQYQVIILEKGGNLFRGLGGPASGVTNNWANDEIAHEARQGLEDQDTLLEPRSFRTQGFTSSPRQFVGDVNTLPTTVGGGTTHYDAKARRFREVDFITNSLMRGYADPSEDPSPTTSAVSGATYANWPMAYRHLEAFYAASEEVVGIQGPATGAPGAVSNPNPWESWRSTPFPMPPGTDQLNSLLPAYAGVSLGYSERPVEVPTAVCSRPYVDGRPACVDCGFCLDFGCPINAKGGGVWQVNDAIAAGAQLISRANVNGFTYAPAAGGLQGVTAVEFLFTGAPSDVIMAGAATPYFSPTVDAVNTIALNPANGDLLILANTPIEATRLSLLSGIAPGSSIEPSGMLGKNLMFHLQTAALAIVDRDIHSNRGRTSTHTLDAFAGPGPTATAYLQGGGAEIPRAGILEMGGNLNPIQSATEVSEFLYGSALKEYMSLAPFTKRLVALTLQGEDMPQSVNAVDLDPDIVDVYGNPAPRITYSSHLYELGASDHYAPKMVELLEAIGSPPSPFPTVHPLFAGTINTTLPAVNSGNVNIESLLDATPFNLIPATRHIMGTHRITLDSDLGPCDPFGRYWKFGNLFHAGGGMYVTAPGYNVTLTMWALSYWQAASIITGVGNPNASGYSANLTDMDMTAATLRGVIASIDPNTMIGGYIRSGGYDTFLRSV